MFVRHIEDLKDCWLLTILFINWRNEIKPTIRPRQYIFIDDLFYKKRFSDSIMTKRISIYNYMNMIPSNVET